MSKEPKDNKEEIARLERQIARLEDSLSTIEANIETSKQQQSNQEDGHSQDSEQSQEQAKYSKLQEILELEMKKALLENDDPSNDNNLFYDGSGTRVFRFNNPADRDLFCKKLQKLHAGLEIPFFIDTSDQKSYRIRIPEACRGKNITTLNQEELAELHKEIATELNEGKSEFAKEYRLPQDFKTGGYWQEFVTNKRQKTEQNAQLPLQTRSNRSNNQENTATDDSPLTMNQYGIKVARSAIEEKLQALKEAKAEDSSEDNQDNNSETETDEGIKMLEDLLKKQKEREIKELEKIQEQEEQDELKEQEEKSQEQDQIFFRLEKEKAEKLKLQLKKLGIDAKLSQQGKTIEGPETMKLLKRREASRMEQPSIPTPSH